MINNQSSSNFVGDIDSVFSQNTNVRIQKNTAASLYIEFFTYGLVKRIILRYTQVKTEFSVTLDENITLVILFLFSKI